MLIGVPTDYDVVNCTIVFSTTETLDEGNASIAFGWVQVNATGELQEYYVLNCWGVLDNFSINVGTILPVEGERVKAYEEAETDVVVVYRGAGFNKTTQERVYQKFRQTLSEHYDNLKEVVEELADYYSDGGLDLVATAYRQVLPVLDELAQIVEANLSDFDFMIKEPKGVFIVDDPTPIPPCDIEYLDAAVVNELGLPVAEIHGDFRAYEDTLSDTGWIQFVGGMSISSGYPAVAGISIRDFTIVSVYVVQVSGIGGFYQFEGGGVGYSYVDFKIWGIAGWRVVVSTASEPATSFPTLVGLRVIFYSPLSPGLDFDFAYITLC